MQKIKNFRSADCVVGAFRYGTAGKMVGSLLLGLYDAEGLLNGALTPVASLRGFAASGSVAVDPKVSSST